MTDHVSRYKELMGGFRDLNQASPAAMEGFGKMHRSGMADGALSQKEKELIALAIGITQHCDGCITIHTHDAIRAGASEEEINDAIGVAVVMGGGPAAVYGANAREAAAQFAEAAR